MVFIVFLVSCGPYFYGIDGRPLVDEETERGKFMLAALEELSRKAGHSPVPDLVVAELAYSTSSLVGWSVVAVDQSMFDPLHFSDDDVRAVIAHEIGHIVRLDSYKPWRKKIRSLGEEKELAADGFAARMVGCEVWRSFAERHYAKMMNGFRNEEDPHPHPDARRDVCIPSGENAPPTSGSV